MSIHSVYRVNPDGRRVLIFSATSARSGCWALAGMDADRLADRLSGEKGSPCTEIAPGALSMTFPDGEVYRWEVEAAV